MWAPPELRTIPVRGSVDSGEEDSAEEELVGEPESVDGELDAESDSVPGAGDDESADADPVESEGSANATPGQAIATPKPPDTRTVAVNREIRFMIGSFSGGAPPRWRRQCGQVQNGGAATDPNNCAGAIGNKPPQPAVDSFDN